MGHRNRRRGHRTDDEPNDGQENGADDGGLPPERQSKPIRRLLAEFLEEIGAAHDSERPDIDGNRQQKQYGECPRLLRCATPTPCEMIGRAKTVTGLANSIRKASPSLFSKCIKSMAMNTMAKASLIGRAVQKADQSTPRPIFVGERESRSSLITSVRPARAALNPETRG